MPARILVVEDDVLAQEFIKAALEERGYRVDVTGDGFAAVERLNKEDYDLALVDYQLPEIDGYASARMMRSVSDAKAPKLVAMTGNAAALERREGAREVFDTIAPKSFDARALLELVERTLAVPQQGRLLDELLRAWREVGLSRRPIAKVLPEPSRIQRLALAPWFELTESFAADLILITDGSAIHELIEARARTDAYLLPVVEFAGGDDGCADATFDAHRKNTWADLATTVKRFAAKRQQLPDDLVYAADLDARILAYLLLSGRSLEPMPDPSRPDCVRYPGFFPDDAVIVAAERLAHRGLLSRRFSQRFHQCAACDSRRLTIREECPQCRSANLHQAEIIHHFRCAHQAPEAQFRSGSHLVCPKCRQHLRHYGGDYDKPGSLMLCDDCATANSDPAVGFVCLDCGKHTDGDAAATRDVFSYSLTHRGQALLRGSAATDVPALPGIPRSVTDAIDSVLAETAGTLEDLTVIEVRYGAEPSILGRDGTQAFATLRRLFVENLQNLLAEHGRVVPHDNVDYVLVGAHEDESDTEFAQSLVEHSGAGLSRSLEPACRIIGIKGRGAAA